MLRWTSLESLTLKIRIFILTSLIQVYVIAAVSDEDIGIDIQKIKSDKHRIAEKNFLPSECAYINEIEDEKINQQRFCEIWTIKEAYLKNIGIGLRKPLNSFEIDLGRTHLR